MTHINSSLEICAQSYFSLFSKWSCWRHMEKEKAAAKYDLDKFRLKPTQSAISPFIVCDLRGGPLETCRAAVSLCITCAVLLADRGRSFALCFSKSFPPLSCWSLGKYGPGKLFPLTHSAWQCQLAATFGSGSYFQGCHGYLPFGLWLLLPFRCQFPSSSICDEFNYFLH